MNNSLEESQHIICKTCNYHIINYPNQFCRRQFLPKKTKLFLFLLKVKLKIRIPCFTRTRNNSSRRTSGNLELDEFIKVTQLAV